MVTFCALHDVEAKEKGEVMAVEGQGKALKAVEGVPSTSKAEPTTLEGVLSTPGVEPTTLEEVPSTPIMERNPPATEPTTVKALKAVNLDELRAQVHLGHVGGEQEQRWYLDSGASNNMTGSKEAFSELDDNVTSTVKFGDGSRVAIRG